MIKRAVTMAMIMGSVLTGPANDAEYTACHNDGERVSANKGAVVTISNDKTPEKMTRERGEVKIGDRRFRKMVSRSVKRQMTDYPATTLQDLYKSFFQDRFGAGHIIADRQGAVAYMNREIEQSENFDGELAEPTGWQGNFVRVNLSLVKERKLAGEVLIAALIRSAEVEMPTVEEWTEEWNEIEKIVEELYPDLPHLEEHRRMIAKTLKEGNYVMHHSEEYNAAYARHYRIILSEIWENELLPMIEGR